MHRLQRLGQTPCEVQLNQDKQQCTPNGIRQVAPSGSAHYSFRLFHLIVEAQARATPVDVRDRSVFISGGGVVRI